MPAAIVSKLRYSCRSARHQEGRSWRTLVERESTARIPPGSSSSSAGRTNASKPPPSGSSPQSTAITATSVLISFASKATERHKKAQGVFYKSYALFVLLCGLAESKQTFEASQCSYAALLSQS